MSEQVVFRVGENVFHVKKSVLNSHPCSLLGRAFDKDADGSAGLHQNEQGEYVLGAAELGETVANGPAALFSSLLGSYSSGVLFPVPGFTREQLLDAAEKLGIDWARTAHDLVSSNSHSEIARGVRMFSVYVLSAHADDPDALLWAAHGLHRLGRHREAAVLLARLLDNQPDNAAARCLALVVSDARVRSRRIGTAFALTAVAAGVVGGAVAAFGTDRVWRCLSQTLPAMFRRPAGRVWNAARAAADYIGSLLHRSARTTTAPSSSRGNRVAGVAQAAISSITNCFRQKKTK